MILKITKSNDQYILLLSLVAFTIPLPMLLNNIAVILLFTYWLILCITKQVIQPHIKSILILTLPFTILLLGSLNSSNNNQLLTELTKSIPFLLFPLILFTVPFNLTYHQFKSILQAFVGGNIIISLVLFGVIIYKSLLNGFVLQTLWALTHQSLSSHVSLNAIYLSLYLAISLVITSYFFLEKRTVRSLKQKMYFITIASLLVIILVFLSSRTVLLSCAFIIIIMFFKHYLENEKFLKVLLRFSLAGVFISVLVLAINPVLKWRIESVVGIQDTDFTVGKEEGLKMRKTLWSSSYEVFKDNVLFGVGTGDFKDELQKVYKKHKYRIQYRHNMNSHNQYLSYLVSNGVFGLILFLFYIFYSVLIYFKSKMWLSFFILILFVLSYFTESYLYTNKGVVIVAFFMTYLFKYSHLIISKSNRDN